MDKDILIVGGCILAAGAIGYYIGSLTTRIRCDKELEELQKFYEDPTSIYPGNPNNHKLMEERLSKLETKDPTEEPPTNSYIVDSESYTHYHEKYDKTKSDAPKNVKKLYSNVPGDDDEIDSIDVETLSDPEESEIEDVILRNQDSEDKQNGEIYIIEADAYGEDHRYDQIKLVYWDGDGTVMDESTNEKVEDYEYYIGSEAIETLRNGEFGSVIYVRNKERRTDYEITLDPRSFYAVIYGYSESDEGE